MFSILQRWLAQAAASGRVFIGGLVLLCQTPVLIGQTSDAFNPGANGSVTTLNRQADGRILVGGAFTGLGGLSRNYLGRLNADGSIDSAFPSTFNSWPNNTVDVILSQPDGRILAGGTFTFFGGQGRNRIARLDTNGVVELAFNPNANGAVKCLALQANGQILVGGAFTTIGGSNITHFARLNTNGTVDGSFNPQVVGNVHCVAVQTNGQIVIGGIFGLVGGISKQKLARLNPDGSLDTNYVSVTSGAMVNTLALQANGQLLVGGQFNSIGGQPCTNLARLNEDGTVDASFVGSANGQVNALAIQDDGSVVVGGGFTALNGQLRNRIGRLDTNGALDAAFNPSANNWVSALLVHADGKTLVGGGFTSIGGQPRNYIAQLDPDGTTPVSWTPNPNGVPYALATQADGKLLVGGAFTSIAGQARSRIARFNSDETLDSAFNPGASGKPSLSIGNVVYCFAVRTNDQILVGGDFNTLSGGTRYSLGLLNADGSLDTNFNCAIGGNYPAVYCLLIQTNGQILLGGSFSSVAGQTRSGLARLNANGTLDATFNPSITWAIGIPTVRSMVVQDDGKIVIAGSFQTLNGQSRNNLGRLNSNGSLDTAFVPGIVPGTGSPVVIQPDGKILVDGLGRLNTDGSVDTNFAAATYAATIALQTDGKILVGGGFSMVANGTTNYCLVRLNSDGSLDTNFNARIPSTQNPTYASVSSLALQPDGTILVGGSFSSLGGQSHTNLGRLLNTGAATQSLSSDGTSVLWLRGGTSPELCRTKFETSSDGLVWTSLGLGTRTNGGWQLAGISVSTNDIIRVRGFLGGGQFGGSGSIIDSMLAPLSIVVNNSNFGFSANEFGFDVRGTTGVGVICEASTNLVDWIGVRTNLLGSTPFYFSDPDAINHWQRFYRVRSQ